MIGLKCVAVTLLAGLALFPGGAVDGMAQQTSAGGVIPDRDASPNLAGIAHVALRVRELPATVAFYERLGFVKAFELSREGKVYEAFIKINDQQFIELYPATPENAQVGFLHICFEGKALASVHDYYIQQGLKPTEVRTAGAGNLLFTMHGPVTPTGDQNLEYTQYMPGSLHSKDIGQHLGADRISTRLTSVAVATADPTTARTFYLDKMAFVPAAQERLALPGVDGEYVTIVPARELAFRAQIRLAVTDLERASKTLQRLSVPFAPGPGTLTLTDPDGNKIVLAGPK